MQHLPGAERCPEIPGSKDALKWLDDKTVAVPKGSCTDRFAQATFKKEGVNPKDYLNQNIEGITSISARARSTLR